MTQKSWTAKEVLEALVRTYLDAITFANLVEFECPTFEEGRYMRRADLLTIMINGGQAPWTTTGAADKGPNSTRNGYVPGGYRVAFEIKVSRADFNVDVKQQWKHSPIRQVVNEFFFVAPEGLIKPSDYGHFDDLPYGVGLIELYRDPRKRWAGTPRLKITKPAVVKLHPETPLWFTYALAHRTLYGRASGGLNAIERNKVRIDKQGLLQPPEEARA